MSVPAELGEVCELSVKVGDYVKEDAIVAIIDTCKASVEARCRASGVVTRVLTRFIFLPYVKVTQVSDQRSFDSQRR
jgi:predicted deacylase